MVFGWHADVVKEMLDVIRLVAHREKLVVHDHLALHEKRVRHLHHCGKLLLHHTLNHEILLFFHAFGVWFDVQSLKVVSKLLGNLSQNFFCKTVGIALELSEGNKLHNISGSKHTSFLVFKRIDICVKSLHLVKISFTNANNDN